MNVLFVFGILILKYIKYMNWICNKHRVYLLDLVDLSYFFFIHVLSKSFFYDHEREVKSLS